MISFKDILRAKQQGSAALNEASLARVYQHVKKEGGSFAIFTSWRQFQDPVPVNDADKKPVPKSENVANYKKLQNTLRSAGLGFFKLLGRWKEEGSDEIAAEPSLFIPGISKDLAHRLGNRYNQDSIVYSGPETDGQITLISKSGSEMRFGKFSPGKVADIFSQVRGRPFVFEGFEYIPHSHSEALTAYLYNLKTGAKP